MTFIYLILDFFHHHDGEMLVLSLFLANMEQAQNYFVIKLSSV